MTMDSYLNPDNGHIYVTLVQQFEARSTACHGSFLWDSGICSLVRNLRVLCQGSLVLQQTTHPRILWIPIKLQNPGFYGILKRDQIAMNLQCRLTLCGSIFRHRRDNQAGYRGQARLPNTYCFGCSLLLAVFSSICHLRQLCSFCLMVGPTMAWNK